MPTRPSGRVRALSMTHILEPGVQMFSCPEGHYWFQEPDRALNAPPFQRDMEVLCDFVHAPCPTTREEALRKRRRRRRGDRSRLMRGMRWGGAC